MHVENRLRPRLEFVLGHEQILDAVRTAAIRQCLRFDVHQGVAGPTVDVVQHRRRGHPPTPGSDQAFDRTAVRQ